MNRIRPVKPLTRKGYIQLTVVEYSRKSFPDLTESFSVLSKFT